MVKRSRIVFPSVQIRSNVTVTIPSVERGRADPRNIIGVVTECSDNELYTIAVKGGILDHKYYRNHFDVCATILYSSDDVRTFLCVKLCNWSHDAVDKVSQDVTVLEVRGVRQIDVNASKPD